MIGPKRKKDKDNPYILNFDDKENKYIIEFIDSTNKKQRVEVTEEVFKIFDHFELEDISQMHKFERHIEHFEIYEESLYQKAKNKPKSVEEEVAINILNEKLKKAISELPKDQKRRIKKYYFEDKTYEKIAKEEKCSKVAVKYSLDIAINNLRKKLKK